MSHFHRVVKTVHMSHRFSPLCRVLGIYYPTHMTSVSKRIFVALPIWLDTSVSSVAVLAIIEPK